MTWIVEDFIQHFRPREGFPYWFDMETRHEVRHESWEDAEKDLVERHASGRNSMIVDPLDKIKERSMTSHIDRTYCIYGNDSRLVSVTIRYFPDHF